MPTAHADPSDSQVNMYLAELQRRGVSYSTPDAVVFLGQASCNALHSGNSVQAVINQIQQSFTGHDTGIILGSAVTVFCSDELEALQAYINNNS